MVAGVGGVRTPDEEVRSEGVKRVKARWQGLGLVWKVKSGWFDYQAVTGGRKAFLGMALRGPGFLGWSIEEIILD